MLILHVSTRLILGGSQENTVLSCEGQARLGHRVHLAFGPIYGPEGSMLARVQAFNERCAQGTERTRDGRACEPIGLHEIPDLVRELSLKRDWRARRQLRELCEKLKPHVVHTHSSKAGVLGRLAAWDVRHDGTPRIIHTIHGPPFMPIEGLPIARLRTRALNFAYTLAERRAARRCDTIVSVADAMTREFLSRRIGTPSQYVTVRSGMEVKKFLPPADATSQRARVRVALGLGEHDLVIGTIARLAQHKGHDDLLDALSPSLKSNPNWKLLWVGDGWWRQRLFARIDSLGLKSQVICTGLVPSERVPEMISAMDILAHPSYREGLPRTVPQALLGGVCPVAYDVDGTGEACIDNQTGKLVRVGDINALRDAIVWLADHPRQRHEMAQRGQAWCVRAFDAQLMVDQLQRVYAGEPVTPSPPA
jgi:glycosyltransferase involved in cell wall biosynthesis